MAYRSLYEDWQTGDAGDQTYESWFTEQMVYPLHHGGS